MPSPIQFHHLYEPRIVTHYRPELAPKQVRSYSQSPTKPRRFMDFVERQTPLGKYQAVYGDFSPVPREQLLTAHIPAYVQAVLEGRPIVGVEGSYGPAVNPHSSGIEWSPALRDSVLWTNGSLLSATRSAILHPTEIHLSPTSGFHHARPDRGDGFCTFSGQVIAALDAWQRGRKRGAWIDLDGHDGNSIDDSIEFRPELEQAIRANLNPSGWHEDYIKSLVCGLVELREEVVAGEIDYVCVALGADNHEHDNLCGEGHLTTEEWIAAVDLVFSFIRDSAIVRGTPLPVVLTLFGGYRDDHPESVLGLHAMGVARALYWLAGVRELADWRADVRPR